jgi:hypothetical protein
VLGILSAKAFEFEKEIIRLVWKSFEQSMACPNSPATGHFLPISVSFRIVKPIEQGDKLSSQSVDDVL